MKHHLIEASIPNEVTLSLRKHFHWVKPDRMDDLIRAWISIHKGQEMLAFDITHGIFGWVRIKITERSRFK